MNEEFTKKRKIRGGHRISTRRTINASSAILDEFDSSNNQLIEKLLQQKITLKEKLDFLQKLGSEILVDVEEKDIEKEIEESDLLRERIHATVVSIDFAVKSTNPAMQASPDDTQSNHISSMKSETTASTKAKLGKLTLEKFKRDITKWSPF